MHYSAPSWRALALAAVICVGITIFEIVIESGGLSSVFGIAFLALAHGIDATSRGES